MNLTFRYHAEIPVRFPHVCGGVILARQLQNHPTPAALLSAFREEQQAVLARLGNTPLSDLETLAGWRAAFRAFGVDPTKYRSAAEALLRRLTKKGDIPSINALVDICNLVSIRHALPVAAFNARVLQGSILVHFAQGNEVFQPLGEAEADNPLPGEVIFTAGSGAVVARRWCWRQSEDSAADLDTTEAIITVEAQHDQGDRAVQMALNDLLELIEKFTGGIFTAGMVGKDRLEISNSS